MNSIASITPGQIRGEGQLGFRALDPFREQRLIDYGNLKGIHYGVRPATMTMRTGARQPVNLTQQMVKTLVTFIAMQAPAADVTPLRADLEFESTVRKQVFDEDARRMRLDEVYQDAATEAIMSGVAFTLTGIKNG